MDRQTAADLLDNLIGMVDDTNGNDYDAALKLGIEVLKSERRGRWSDHQRGRWIYAKCSECGAVKDVRSNYCPNCGARMDGEQDDIG